MRIVYWAHLGLAQAAITKALQAVPGIDLTIVKSFEDLKATLPGADGLVAPDAPDHLAQEVGVLMRAPTTTLRWLHVVTAGREAFNAADLPPGITVTGPAGAHAPALAEHAMAFLLAFTRRIPDFAANIPKHDWNRTATERMSSLEGATLAIVGLGNAGRAVAKRARAFDMTVLAATRDAEKREPLVDEVHPLSALREVLARADFIVVTIASTPQTRNFIGAAEFSACKRTAYLVNVARGAVIDQAALVAALKDGQIAGAGLDVTEPEPLPPGDPLWDAPNLLLTPHVGGGQSAKSGARLVGRVIENLERFKAGTLVPT